MRCDTPVYFQLTGPGRYDKSTGDYVEGAVVETMRMASVTSAGVNTLNIVYGKIRQGSLLVRLNTPYDRPFDHIRIGEKLYQVDFSRRLRTKKSFIVSEVQ